MENDVLTAVHDGIERCMLNEQYKVIYCVGRLGRFVNSARHIKEFFETLEYVEKIYSSPIGRRLTVIFRNGSELSFITPSEQCRGMRCNEYFADCDVPHDFIQTILRPMVIDYTRQRELFQIPW